MFKFLFLFLMMSFPLNESLYLHRFEFRFLTFHPLLLPSSSIDRVNWPWSWVDDCCLCYNIPPQKINRDSDFICHSANLSSCHFPLFQFHLTYMIFACTCLFAVAAISRSSKRSHCQNLNIQRHLFHRFHLFIQIVLWVNWHFIFMIQIPLNWLSVQPVIQPDFVTRSSALFQLPFHHLRAQSGPTFYLTIVTFWLHLKKPFDHPFAYLCRFVTSAIATSVSWLTSLFI